MAALPSNWHDAFQRLTQTWTDPAEPWASHRSGFLDKLGINDESADADVAELFRRVEEELHTDAERHAALTDEAKRAALLPESFTAEHHPPGDHPSEEQPSEGCPGRQSADAVAA